MKQLDKIRPLEQEFSKWYTDVVKQGNLIEYGPTKGSLIYKPNSYGIWENIQKELNIMFKKIGVQNVYLPLLIPESYIKKEKDHVKGFAPELATVTKVGNKELTEPLIIRPTSEVLFGELFSQTVRSQSDLPIVYNQWANVLRWEKTTNPFLRSREFLWQEGHTVHAIPEEARKMTRKMLKIYNKFVAKYLAIPTVMGKKTPKEKFAGAVTTYTIEAMMKDGKALQAGTSHYLGQNFSKPFDIKFQNSQNQKEFAYQSSWGVSTRLLGAIIMTHGDNRGIIVPPMIAPTQIDILELFGDKNPKVKEATNQLMKVLSRKFRVRIDASSKGPGFKAGQSEIQGTPLRIEVGPRDLEQGFVTLVRRDNLEKTQVKIEDVKATVKTTLDAIQKNLYDSAKQRLEDNSVECETYEEMKEHLQNGKFVKVPFAGGSKEENKIKEETLATSRCIPLEGNGKQNRCIITNVPTKRWVIFARAY